MFINEYKAAAAASAAAEAAAAAAAAAASDIHRVMIRLSGL